jgi:2-methylcitrate dehydratase
VLTCLIDNTAAILAIMDWLSRSSASGTLVHTGPPLTMRTFLVAVIKAYEIQGCFLLRNAFNAVGIDHVMLVKVASTAVVSWLLGLSEEQTMAAISHAWMDVAPLRVYRSGSNTIPRKGWAAGDACMRAIHFALLVRRGQSGSPTPLTMPRWGFYATKWHKAEKFDLPKPYTSWVIENIFFKVMPVEGFCIAPVEAAVEQSRLLREKGLNPSKDIAKIEIRTNSAADTITNKSGKLHNAADRDHCMQYVVAVALLKGAAPDSTDYEDASEWASSATIEELRNKTVVWVDDQLTQDQLNPDKKSLASGVVVHLTNGEVLQEVLVEFPNGHVESALTLASVYEKFKRNMGLMFSDEEVKGIEDFVDGGGDKSISEFVDLLVRDEFGA